MLAASPDAAVTAAATAGPTVGLAIGARRKRALRRIGALLYLVVFIYTLGAVLSIITLVWTALDLFVELVFNRDWLDDNGMFADWIQRWFAWTQEMQTFIATGNGEFAWLP